MTLIPALLFCICGVYATAQETVEILEKPIRLSPALNLSYFAATIGSDSKGGKFGIDVYDLGKKDNLVAGFNINWGKTFRDDDETTYMAINERQVSNFTQHDIHAVLSSGKRITAESRNVFINGRVLFDFMNRNRLYSIKNEDYDSLTGQWATDPDPGAINVTQPGLSVTYENYAGSITPFYGGGLELNIGTRFDKGAFFMILQASPKLTYFFNGNARYADRENKSLAGINYLKTCTEDSFLEGRIFLDVQIGLKIG